MTAELTATTRTGVGRFTYPRDGRPALFHVRTGGSLAGNSAASIRIGEDNTTITGSATTGDFCGKNNSYTVYFAMKFSRPFISYGTFDGNSVFAGPAARIRGGAGDGWSFRRHGARGAHRVVLRECGRGVGQPCCRGGRRFRRRARCGVEPVECGVVARQGGRCW
ncbi:alpha-1,2-mannosidase family domain protein [Mycobacterium xenopi 3993]|nr:alpha-1,2-mannosidase family domain protein [Mycobacterium xenopi 3993]